MYRTNTKESLFDRFIHILNAQLILQLHSWHFVFYLSCRNSSSTTTITGKKFIVTEVAHFVHCPLNKIRTHNEWVAR